MRKYSKLIIGTGLAVLLSFTLNSPPQNFKITYVSKNADGSVFNIVKYYLCDENKFRTEYISTSQTTIDASTEVSADLSNDSKSDNNVKSDVKSKTEKIKESQPHTIVILRNDKHLVWTIEPEFKAYSQVPLREGSWGREFESIFMNDCSLFTKKGETKLLDFTCDIYEHVQNVQDDKWMNIYYIARDNNAVLKYEIWKNGTLMQITEASEFNMDRPSPSLFEIPKGFKKSQNN